MRSRLGSGRTGTARSLRGRERSWWRWPSAAGPRAEPPARERAVFRLCAAVRRGALRFVLRGLLGGAVSFPWLCVPSPSRQELRAGVAPPWGRRSRAAPSPDRRAALTASNALEVPGSEWGRSAVVNQQLRHFELGRFGRTGSSGVCGDPHKFVVFQASLHELGFHV